MILSPLPTANNNLPTAITMGDPAGIGGELVLKVWKDNRNFLNPFFVIDDPNRLASLAKRIGLEIPIETITHPSKAVATFSNSLPVLKENIEFQIDPGKPNPRSASAVIKSIDRGIELVIAGQACALVTNPIHKSTLYQEGFSYPGHTEYLASKIKPEAVPVMMLASDEVRVVPITTHLALSKAIKSLSKNSISHCAIVTHKALKYDFGLKIPRLAITGLNPHAGENGYFGNEEKLIIDPAVKKLQSKGININGPYPADSLFHEQARKNYDAIICMYHDQALIPLKTMAFNKSVNVTLGLPFIRTSPDHGTAFDIAGTGKANPESLIAAILLAQKMAKNRLHKNKNDNFA